MTTQLDWAAAKAAMLDVAARAFGEVPRDRKVRCPFHGDGSPSLHVYDDGWHCYGCGEGGDAVDLVARLDGVSKVEAYRRIMGTWDCEPLPTPPPKPRAWEHQTGAEGMPDHPRHGAPSVAYPYSRDGQLIGYVCRWDPPDGDKVIRPASSVLDLKTGEVRWEWVSFPEPRPLYRPEHDDKALVIVEGEKAADHLRGMGYRACTWPGGSNAWAKADWSMVQAAKVILWPDNDAAGQAAMLGIARLLDPRGIAIKWVDLEGMPEGGDAADLDREACRARLTSAKAHQEPSRMPLEVSRPEDTPAAHEAPTANPWPFRCLGHRNDKYYFWVRDSQRIITLGVSQFSRMALLQLAPPEWFEAMFPGKGGWVLETAGRALMATCDALGIYEERQERGRGIWRDDGRIIYHYGSGAVIDGKASRLSDIAGAYTYPIAGSLPAPGQPLTDDEARTLVLDTFRIPSWHDPAYGEIIAGWVMCGLLAGVLRWRPSVWVNGAAGSGKSEVLSFVNRLLEPFASMYQGNASEAGIRQDIGKDARPIIIDEAEPGNDQRGSRMAGILTMLRQASSDTSARVVRGTVSGEAVRYHVRSPFLLGSIQVSMNVQADRERITLVTLKSAKAGEIPTADAEAIYRQWLDAVEGLPHDVPRRLLGRAVQVAPIARSVVKAMTEALVATVGNRREADQLGALMAGAWLLRASHVPDAQEASAWVGRHDWARVNDMAHETDAERARSSLLGMMTIGDGDRATVADRVSAIREPMGAGKEAHEKVLAWYGLRVFDNGWLFVSNRNDLRRSALKDTGFGEVADLFRQLKGHSKTSQRIAGETHRGIFIPLP